MCEITEKLKLEVWGKGIVVKGYDPHLYRKDSCGAWMRYDKFRDHKSIFGWEIDHIYPISKLRERNIPDEMGDRIENLRPLNWINDDIKKDDYPSYHAGVIAENDHNKLGDYQFEISIEERELLENLYRDFI